MGDDDVTLAIMESGNAVTHHLGVVQTVLAEVDTEQHQAS
jgi:hypothetical protein